MRVRASGVPKSWRFLKRQQISVPSSRAAQDQPTRDPGYPKGAVPFPTGLSFPQLKVARDPEMMREVFQRHLRLLGGKYYEVRECQIYRFLYKQSKRCILQYDLRLAEPGTDREWSQWVTASIYSGDRARRLWKKLQRSELGHAKAGNEPALAPFSYVPDLEMLVQYFPYDRKLPAIRLLMSGSPPSLEPLLLSRFGPGAWQIEAWEADAVRYLAEKRATLRLTLRARNVMANRVEERHFYAKIYNNEEGEQTYRVLRALWKRADERGAGFTVGRPVTYLSNLKALIQEEAPGASLEDVFLHREHEAITAVRKVARALALLHLDRLGIPRRCSVQDEVSTLKRRGELVKQACPPLKPQVEKIVNAVVCGLEEVPPAPTHRDLNLTHILLEGDSLALVDLDEFAGSDPILDVAEVLSHLTVMPLRYPLLYDRARATAVAFAEEYFAYVPEAWRTRLPIHYAGAVLRTAAGLFWSQEQDWPDKIEALIEEAEASLPSRVW